jgi:hypothetical protein
VIHRTGFGEPGKGAPHGNETTELKGAAKNFATGFATDLANGVSATEALQNALDRLKDKLIDLAASKLFDAVFASATGGTSGLLSGLLGHAEGGVIRGKGTGTSDSNLRRVSNGEFIVNAAQTSKYLDLLQSINSGKSLKVPNVGGSILAPQVNQKTHFAPRIHVQGGSTQQNQDAADRIERQIYSMFKEFYQKETVRELRYGGLFSRR